MLVISADSDRTVSRAIPNASYKKQLPARLRRAVRAWLQGCVNGRFVDERSVRQIARRAYAASTRFRQASRCKDGEHLNYELGAPILEAFVHERRYKDEHTRNSKENLTAR